MVTAKVIFNQNIYCKCNIPNISLLFMLMMHRYLITFIRNKTLHIQIVFHQKFSHIWKNEIASQCTHKSACLKPALLQQSQPLVKQVPVTCSPQQTCSSYTHGYIAFMIRQDGSFFQSFYYCFHPWKSIDKFLNIFCFSP